MKRNLTCIVCPIGCALTATIEDGKVISVEGNTCPRGAAYAKDECTNPTRVVTSTMVCENGKVVPVKTNRAIPKDKIFECMNIINHTTLNGTPKIGDVAVKDVFGCDIVVTGM